MSPDRESIRTAVFGGTGYIAGELLRLLVQHPRFKIAASFSTSQAGEPVVAAFPNLAGTTADAQTPNLGASGAIAAVLGAYFVLFPNAKILAMHLYPMARISKSFLPAPASEPAACAGRFSCDNRNVFTSLPALAAVQTM